MIGKHIYTHRPHTHTHAITHTHTNANTPKHTLSLTHARTHSFTHSPHEHTRTQLHSHSHARICMTYGIKDALRLGYTHCAKNSNMHTYAGTSPPTCGGKVGGPHKWACLLPLEVYCLNHTIIFVEIFIANLVGKWIFFFSYRTNLFDTCERDLLTSKSIVHTAFFAIDINPLVQTQKGPSRFTTCANRHTDVYRHTHAYGFLSLKWGSW